MEPEAKKDKAVRADRDARNRELVRRYREGDGDAGDLLLRENDGLLRKAVSSLKGFRHMEEDLLQEARLKMITEIAEKFDLQQSKVRFSTYAFQCLSRMVSDIVHKEPKEEVSLDRPVGEDGETLLDLVPIDINSIPAEKGGNPENAVLRREYNAELEKFIGSGFLTAGEQAVIRGIVRGKENREIGVRLHRRDGEIEKMKKRALEKVMYAGEREELFPEYAARYIFDLSLKNEGDAKCSAALEEFLTDSGFLTAGEQAVMRGIADGDGYDEIGARLHRKAWEIEKIEKRAREKMMYARDREELFPRGFLG